MQQFYDLINDSLFIKQTPLQFLHKPSLGNFDVIWTSCCWEQQMEFISYSLYFYINMVEYNPI